MPIVEIKGLGDSYEDKPAPEGSYDLRIMDIKDGRNKKDTCDQTMVMIKVESDEYPDAATIFHYLTFVGPDDDESSSRNKMRGITRFLKAFNIPFEKNGFNTEDLVGATASDIFVKQEEYEGSVNNRVSLPRVE